MRWPVLLDAANSLVDGDAELQAMGFPRVFRTGEITTPLIPGIGYTVVATPTAENTEAALLQYDIWARSYADAVKAERRLRALLDHRLPIVVAGERMTLEYDDGRDHPDAEPGAAHRSVDFRLETHKEG